MPMRWWEAAQGYEALLKVCRGCLCVCVCGCVEGGGGTGGREDANEILWLLLCLYVLPLQQQPPLNTHLAPGPKVYDVL